MDRGAAGRRAERSGTYREIALCAGRGQRPRCASHRRQGTKPFYYDKGLPIEKTLHPDTILAWAQNGQLLEHLHGAPVRLLVPGWSGNWSVKWLNKLEVMEHEPIAGTIINFIITARRRRPNKELITTIGVKSIITQPNDETETMSPGVHMIRGYAWSGAGAIAQVDVSVDGGESWHSAHIEPPCDRFIWVRWSYRWDARQKGTYTLMSRATDEVGRVQSPGAELRHTCARTSAQSSATRSR